MASIHRETVVDVGAEQAWAALKTDLEAGKPITAATLHLQGVVARLGISEAIASKTIRPDADIVSELVAKGEVEIGMVVVTQILTTPGVDLVGPLPAELQAYVTFVAGISSESKAPDGASQLIEFLRGPRAAAVIKSQGMEPAR